MTDNRTTELREKLDELGIEHFDYDKGGRTQTQWEAPDGKRHFTYETSDNPAKTARLVIAWHPTPEQAIAATLGSTTRADRLLAELNNDRRINKQLKIANALLRKSEAAKIERIEALEELVLDLHADLMEYGCTPNAHRANYKPRFEALGIEVDEWMESEHYEPNPDCSAMLYETFTGNMCSHYEPKDGVVAILREAARNLSDYHDAGEALRRLTDTLNVYHALETLADMIERDYVRRESIEEVMDNDRALVDENSMLARELLKLRAELEKATNNLNSANEDFENARAELTAERDKLQEQLLIGWECECRLQAERDELQAKVDELKELNEYHALQYELASEDCDRLQVQVDTLKSRHCPHYDANEHTCDVHETRIAELTAEREQYRKLFGMALDWAHEITMLESSVDEGMA